MKKLLFVPLLIVFVTLGVYSVQQQRRLNNQIDIQLDQKEIRIKTMQQKMLELDKQLDTIKGSSEQDKQKIEQLQNEKEQLEKDLQAKLKRQEEERLAKAKVEEASKRASLTATAHASSGDKNAWLQASGIPQDQWAYVDYIISHESGWRVGVVNSLGCKGLGQSCPNGSGLTKDCPNWKTDPVCQLKHFDKYAQRYGGWYGSYIAWQKQSWW